MYTIERVAGGFLPELIVLAGAGASLLAGLSRAWRDTGTSLIGFFAVLAALIVSIVWGSSNSEIVLLGLRLDTFTFYVRAVTLAIGVVIVLVNWRPTAASERGEFMALILFSLLGVLLTAEANDLLTLFLAIELVSVPTYVLIALSREDARASEAAVKYFFLGALAAAVLAYGFSFLYGAYGTTVITEIAAIMAPPETSIIIPAAFMIGWLLSLGGLCFKVAAVPCHLYVSDVYEGAASPVAGMLGFVPKFAGFIALVKLFDLLRWQLPDALFWLVWAIAAVTMTVGNVLALLQKNVKRVLAYSSIAHTGYMLIALLIGPSLTRAAVHDGAVALFFYVAVYGLMNLGAFAVLAMFEKSTRPIETFDDLAGLARTSPAAGFALAVCAFSLMGFPLTAGFVGKWYILGGALSIPPADARYLALVALVIVGVVNSAIGAAYYLRIVAAAYIGEDSQQFRAVGGIPIRLGVALCAIPLLVVFIWPAGLVQEARRAVALERANRLAAIVHDDDVAGGQSVVLGPNPHAQGAGEQADRAKQLPGEPNTSGR